MPDLGPITEKYRRAHSVGREIIAASDSEQFLVQAVSDIGNRLGYENILIAVRNEAGMETSVASDDGGKTSGIESRQAEKSEPNPSDDILDWAIEQGVLDAEAPDEDKGGNSGRNMLSTLSDPSSTARE